jgi:hypothetical protein
MEINNYFIRSAGEDGTGAGADGANREEGELHLSLEMRFAKSGIRIQTTVNMESNNFYSENCTFFLVFTG